jgi:DNA-binding MarR family transcriptional regulator
MKHTASPAKSDGGALPALGEALEFVRLIRAIDHGLEKASKRLAVTAGVTSLQGLVLHIVGRFPGISAGQLAATLHVHPSTLTGVLSRLERRGLLSRRPDPRDGRRASLGLTRAGQARDAAVVGTAEDAVQQLLEELPAERMRVTREVLALLAERLGVDCHPR